MVARVFQFLTRTQQHRSLGGSAPAWLDGYAPPTPGIHHDKATFYIQDTQRLVRGITNRIDDDRSA